MRLPEISRYAGGEGDIPAGWTEYGWGNYSVRGARLQYEGKIFMIRPSWDTAEVELWENVRSLLQGKEYLQNVR